MPRGRGRLRRLPSRQLVPVASGSRPCCHPVSLPIACLLCVHGSMRAFRLMLLAHVRLGTGRKRSPVLCACCLDLAHSASLEERTNRSSRNGGSTICLVGNSVGLANSVRMFVACQYQRAKVPGTLVHGFTLRRARPNPSLKLTRYGRHCKPGLSHSYYRLSPGLQYLPPRAA
jgi:hypothetical protein